MLALNSCNAPRENPLDPENPSNKLYVITGKLVTAEKTSRVIGDAIVHWRQENLFGLTADDGSFMIQCKVPTDGWLLFEKPGFSSDSFFVDWNLGKTVTISPSLNALPVLDSIIIYSVVKNKYSSTELLLYFEAKVSDVDDDIDTLKISCPQLSINVNLNKINSDYFEAKFTDYDLNLINFNDIIGKPFYVEAVTSGGKSLNIGSSTVKRIIRDEIIILSPINSDTLETHTPELIWTRFTPGFSFNYQIEIYTDEPEPLLLWKKENISSDDISIQVETQLTVTPTSDNFFWVIWCVDEFNNRSRSKPAGFTLK
jgi:hypothetical protein